MMFLKYTAGFLLAALLVCTSTSQAQTVDKKTLTLDGARAIMAAAVTEAKARKAPGGAIAVVDDGGHLLALERLDNTFAAAANISIGKARTAALFKRSTNVFEEIIKAGRTSMVALADFTPLQGGVPITVDGQVLGAVGVSGAASAQQDEDIASAAANAGQRFIAHAHMSAPAEVTFIEGVSVATAFARGTPLLEVNDYKIHASRREAPGMAEVHERDTDIIYVLDGTATFVTGGTAVEATTVAPEEIRAKTIQGGQTRQLARGDVIVVPNGVAHWFQDVKGPFTYYVVKVRATDGGAR
jgi:glc operon protein GlcG